MKSKIFKRVELKEDNEEFKRDLLRFIIVKEEKLNIIFQTLIEYQQSLSTKQKMDLINKVGEKESPDLNPMIIGSCLSILDFIAQQYKDEEMGDLSKDIDNLANDLLELKVIDESQAPIFIKRMNLYKDNILPVYLENMKKIEYSIGVLPSMASFSTTVELRAILRNEFYIGMESDKYNPIIIGLAPVASVSIDLNQSSIEKISFQMTKKEIKAFIERLNAAYKIIGKLEEITSGIKFDGNRT
jgi:hypothetical protein